MENKDNTLNALSELNDEAVSCPVHWN